MDARVQAAGLVEQFPDGGVLGVPGPRGEEVGVLAAALLRGGREPSRVLRVHDEQAAEPGDLGERAAQLLPVELGELLDAGGRQERLEAEDPGVVQCAQVLDVVGQGAAPEADVDVCLGRGDGLLDAQVGDRRGGRDRVERHVDQGRDAAGGRRARGGPEALPLGAARVVDVHVGVDEAGQQDVVAEVFQAGPRRYAGVVGAYGRDPAVGDLDRGGPGPFGGDDACRAQHQSDVGHPDPSPSHRLLPRNEIQRSVEEVFTLRHAPVKSPLGHRAHPGPKSGCFHKTKLEFHLPEGVERQRGRSLSPR